MLNFAALITLYRYAAVLIGTFFEGETILVIAGFLAHRGYLMLDGVVIAAFVGAVLGDQLYVHIGRWKGREFIAARPRLARHRGKVERLLQRHRIWLILGFRVVYGIRTVTPFVLGASQVSARLFTVLNVIGALVWAVAIGSAGYYFGKVMEPALGQIKHYELLAVGLLLGVALAAALGRYVIRRYRRRRNP